VIRRLRFLPPYTTLTLKFAKLELECNSFTPLALVFDMMCYCVCVCVRESKREREREIERERERERDRQRETERERKRERQTERDRDREREREDIGLTVIVDVGLKPILMLIISPFEIPP